ncbi:MAG: hypothetical protein JST16_07195 [Bdellovibrionales bacterium]|nr:hypothetical protein [Bdellovibrionales bacterium]
MEFLVTTSPGLEDLLLSELHELGLENARLEASHVIRFEGEWAEACRVITRSRIASRILLSLRNFSARNPAMLYDQVRRVDWTQHIPQGKTMAVFVHGSGEGADFALSFAPLKIKDAICDEIKKRGLPRPNVDRKDPNVRVEAFIHGGKCEISVDLASEPLHRRGYRQDGGEAPIKENRAAALLRFAGYDGSKPFIDPFCGSGTLAIEAGLMATNTAPGLLKRAESYSLWDCYPAARLALVEEREKAKQECHPDTKHVIVASDLSKAALAKARENIRLAGLAEVIETHLADARTLESPDSFIIANPPYGVRLKEQEAACTLLGEFTRQVKHACAGSTLAFVVEAGPLEKSTGFKPSRKKLIKSSGMELKFLVFEIFAGRRSASSRDQ